MDANHFHPGRDTVGWSGPIAFLDTPTDAGPPRRLRHPGADDVWSLPLPLPIVEEADPAAGRPRRIVGFVERVDIVGDTLIGFGRAEATFFDGFPDGRPAGITLADRMNTEPGPPETLELTITAWHLAGIVAYRLGERGSFHAATIHPADPQAHRDAPPELAAFAPRAVLHVCFPGTGTTITREVGVDWFSASTMTTEEFAVANADITIRDVTGGHAEPGTMYIVIISKEDNEDVSFRTGYVVSIPPTEDHVPDFGPGLVGVLRGMDRQQKRTDEGGGREIAWYYYRADVEDALGLPRGHLDTDPDEDDTTDTTPAPGVAWTGVLALLDTPTIDGRIICAPAGGVPRTGPLPLTLFRISAGAPIGSTARTSIGVIDCVEIDGNRLLGSGWINDRDPEGRDLLDKMEENGLRCGADLDDAETEVGDDDLLRVTTWRLMGATVYTDSTAAAFPEARIKVVTG